MKVIAFILSVYLLFLFAAPCCSFDNCPEDKTEQMANHEAGDTDCGGCSPFFTCAGCSGATISFEKADIKFVPPLSDHPHTGYILSLIPDVPYDFWQPPRLG
jgi:hypothetical protein